MYFYRRKKKCIRCFDDNDDDDDYSTDGGDSESNSEGVLLQPKSHSFMHGKDGKECRKRAKCSHLSERRDYFTDESDSLATTGDSDSVVGSPMHSINSNDTFSTQSKSFCRNSPSPLDVGQSEFDLTLKPREDNSDMFNQPSGVKLNGHSSSDIHSADLNSTLTSSDPIKLETE